LEEPIGGKSMKKTPILCLILMLGLISTHIASAGGIYETYGAYGPDTEKPEAWEIVGDILWLRPIGFIGTVLSATAYVVSLPVYPFDKEAEKTMDTLVKDYQYFTFERPLGH
jgi:hypothetical protein